MIDIGDLVEANQLTPIPLQELLSIVAGLQAEKARVETDLKNVKKRLDEIESIAVEALAASGLDGVKAAGKSWWTRDSFVVSVPTENREAVVEAAKAAGLGDMVAVNTTTLKSWLMENRDAERSDDLAAGTPFEGLIEEYREVRLSSRTLG